MMNAIDKAAQEFANKLDETPQVQEASSDENENSEAITQVGSSSDDSAAGSQPVSQGKEAEETDELARAEEENEPAHIPLSRLKKSLAQNRELKSKIAELEKKMGAGGAASAQSQSFTLDQVKELLASSFQKPSTNKNEAGAASGDWLADYFKDEPATTPVEQQKDQQERSPDRLARVEQQLNSFVRQQNVNAIVAGWNVEIEQASKDYPNVSVDVLVGALRQGYDKSLVELAEKIDDYQISLQDEAVARYLKENNMNVPVQRTNKATAPPVGFPRGKPDKPGATSLRNSKPRGPRTVEEARLLFLQEIGAQARN